MLNDSDEMYNSNAIRDSDEDTKMNIIDKFFIESYDLLLFKIYQCFNLIMSILSIYICVAYSSWFWSWTWILVLCMIGILIIHVPLGSHILTDETESKSVNDTYFIQTSVYYFILSICLVIANVYYGDPWVELVKYLVYFNILIILSGTCFYVSAKSITYVRNKRGTIKKNVSSDRIVCEPE